MIDWTSKVVRNIGGPVWSARQGQLRFNSAQVKIDRSLVGCIRIAQKVRRAVNVDARRGAVKEHVRNTHLRHGIAKSNPLGQLKPSQSRATEFNDAVIMFEGPTP